MDSTDPARGRDSKDRHQRGGILEFRQDDHNYDAVTNHRGEIDIDLVHIPLQCFTSGGCREVLDIFGGDSV